MTKPTNSRHGWDRIRWQKATKSPTKSPLCPVWGGGGGGRSLLWLVHYPCQKIAKAQVYSSFNVADRLNIKSCVGKTRKVNFRIILRLSDQWQWAVRPTFKPLYSTSLLLSFFQSVLNIRNHHDISSQYIYK
jgi:hypothetical protein